MNRGFSLVELSIVLVILGLLTGGILAGQSLIRAAELRRIPTNFQQYQSAIYAFRDKYFALPGDMANATSFWGKDNATCPAHTGTTSVTGVCNGDGNGSAYAAGEIYQFWRHLAAAGLIEGSYTGIVGDPPANIGGINVPKGSIGESYWYTSGCCAGGGTSFSLVNGYGNNLRLMDSSDYLKPEEAWNIDTKLDDGRPAYGKVVAGKWSGCTDATAWTDRESDYVLSTNSLVCQVTFPHSF